MIWALVVTVALVLYAPLSFAYAAKRGWIEQETAVVFGAFNLLLAPMLIVVVASLVA